MRSDYCFGIFPAVSENSRKLSTKFRQIRRIDNRKDQFTIKSFGKYLQSIGNFGIINPGECKIHKINYIPEILHLLGPNSKSGI